MAPGHIHTQDPHIQVQLKENPKETFFVSIIGGNKNISSEVLCIRQHRFIFINLLSIQFSVPHMSFTCLFLFHVSLSILFSFKTISIFSCKWKKKENRQRRRRRMKINSMLLQFRNICMGFKFATSNVSVCVCVQYSK